MGTKSHTKQLAAVALLVASALGNGCGNFSNEDLLFLAALPRKDDVALAVVNATANQQSNALSQALEACSERDLLCKSREISGGINTGVFMLLDLVDAIAFNHAPSKREPGRRIWGPIYLAAEGKTLRFEMRRTDFGYEYCLHAVGGRSDNSKADDVGCDTATDDSGLARVLHGSFAPDADGTARSGAGSLVFDLNALKRAGLGKAADRGVFTVDYDNTDGATRITVHIADAGSDDGNIPAQADYGFVRSSDGSGTFRFTVEVDIVKAVFFERETLDIGACWEASRAGRAEATVAGGDMGSDVVTLSQCWDANLVTVYFHDGTGQQPDVGTAAACATCALPPMP